MSLKLLSVIALILFIGSAFADNDRDNNCNTQNVNLCTNSNSECIGLATDDGARCQCVQGYAECLLTIGCDVDDDSGGDGNNRGNAKNEFQNIRNFCITYSCGGTAACNLASSASSLVANLGVVTLAVATALVTFL